nr:MAG TPA: hypothetical protein [Microviridae sp.]
MKSYVLSLRQLWQFSLRLEWSLVPCHSQFLRTIRIQPKKRSKLQLHRLTQPILM